MKGLVIFELTIVQSHANKVTKPKPKAKKL